MQAVRGVGVRAATSCDVIGDVALLVLHFRPGFQRPGGLCQEAVRTTAFSSRQLAPTALMPFVLSLQAVRHGSADLSFVRLRHLRIRLADASSVAGAR